MFTCDRLANILEFSSVYSVWTLHILLYCCLPRGKPCLTKWTEFFSYLFSWYLYLWPYSRCLYLEFSEYYEYNSVHSCNICGYHHGECWKVETINQFSIYPSLILLVFTQGLLVYTHEYLALIPFKLFPNPSLLRCCMLGIY